MKRKLDYYYLTDISSRFIVSVTVFCFFINLIYAFPWFSSFLNTFNTVGQVFAIIGIPAIPAIGCFLVSHKSAKADKASVVLYDSKIDRTDRLPLIKEKTGLYIVTGESGSGKSRLLKSVFSQKDCLIKDKDYSLPWNEREFSDKRYIILDQFENALPYLNEEKLRIIDSAINDDRLVVLSFKKEAYGDVCKLFTDKISNSMSGDSQNVFWLSFSDEEKSDLIDKMNHTFDGQTNNQLYADIANGLKRNKITFIQYTFLMKNVRKEQAKKANQQYSNADYRYDVLIAEYLKNTLDGFCHSQLAYQILYLLSLDTKGIYISRRSDFRNISLESQQAIDDTLTFLSANELISTNRAAGETGHPDIDRFAISHDYISEIMKMICGENIDDSIRSNIEYYHNSIQLKQTEASYENDIKYDTDKICESFSGNTIEVIPDEAKMPSFRAIDAALGFMLLAIAALNAFLIYYYSSCFGAQDAFCLSGRLSFVNSLTGRSEAFIALALINVMVGISIYYVYHYYKHFLRVFHHKPLRVAKKDRSGKEIIEEHKGFKNVVTIVMLIGCIGCLTAFVFQDYWAIGLGVEILLNGCLCFAMMKRTRRSERKTFSSLGINMCSSGVVVIGLAIAYRFCIYLSFAIAFAFFLLYVIFMLLCSIRHINRGNTLALVGRIVFNKEVYKKKDH